MMDAGARAPVPLPRGSRHRVVGPAYIHGFKRSSRSLRGIRPHRGMIEKIPGRGVRNKEYCLKHRPEVDWAWMLVAGLITGAFFYP